VTELRQESESGFAGKVAPPERAFPRELDRRNSLARAIVATIREPLVVLDRSLRVIAASRSFCQTFQVQSADTQDRPLPELCPGTWDIPTLQQLLGNVISRDLAVEAYEVELDIPNIGRRQMLLNARQILDESSPQAVLLVGLEDVTVRSQAEGLKDDLLRQEKSLRREIEHRVANSLQIIASILLLKARMVPEDVRVHLRDAHKRVISVATVQRQLCRSGLGRDTEIGPYMSTLCEGLASSMIGDDRPVTVTAICSGGTVKTDDAVSIGLIVTELVINAIKYAFPDGRKGSIAVAVAVDGQDWCLTVCDDGIGREQSPAAPIHVGLGTSIVEALARQLKARIEVSGNAPGTRVSIIRAA
jgi:two-component sensor histidine kinase